MCEPRSRRRWGWRLAHAVCVCAAFGRTASISAQSAEPRQTSQQPAGDQQASVQAANLTPPAAAPVSTSQQAVSPAAKPPSPPALGLNGRITDWLQIRGEFRNRTEGFDGGGFKSNASDSYTLDRFRFDALVTPSKTLKFLVQVQDARAFDKAAGGQGVPFRDTWDLHQAYGEFDSRQVSVRVGRQELFFGEQRLIGHLNWTNTARSFDGVRATVSTKPFKFDVFAASVVTLLPEDFDTSGHGNGIYAFYGSAPALIPKATIEPYFVWRQSKGLAIETGGKGELHQATLGARALGKLPAAFDYGVEMAAQTGTVASDDVRAWAGHWIVGRTWSEIAAKPRPFLEYNYASGDSNSKDGTRGTFDQLYPTGHEKYGLADQVGWRNIDDLRAGVELKPARQWQVTGSFHSYWLADAHDALYNSAGAVVARSAKGTAGRFVGREVDAIATYTFSTQLQVNGGYAYMSPGEFLAATTPGQSYSYGYVMLTYVFIGNRPAAPK